MNMLNLFSRLRELGINLDIVDNNLKINAPKGKLNPDLLKELKDKKEEIVRFLQRHVQAKDKYSSIEHVEKKEYYVLSSAQKRIYILHRMEQGTTVYNIPEVVILEGVIDKEKLEKTFNRLIERHESLRTSFEMKENQPVQEIHDTVNFEIEYYVANASPQPLITNFIRAFDLSKAPLFRVGLIKTGEEHILMIDTHHIISDGFSMGIFTKEFMAFYAGETLPNLRIQYKDFAEWQRSENESAGIKKQEEFWLNQFSGEIPVLYLPTDYDRPVVQSFSGHSILFDIEKEEKAALKQIVMEQEATLFMALLSVCNILLAKLSGQEDIVIGTPTAGRRHADLEPLIGMFVNTLALRNYPQGKTTFKNFLKEVKINTLALFDNQEYQFEDLVEKLELKRDTGRNPLFDVVFALQNLDIPEVEIPGLKLKPYESEDKNAKFDLHFTCSDGDEILRINLQYCTHLFKEETAQRFTRCFKQIISCVIDNTDIKIEEIDILTEKERAELVVDFNNSEIEFPRDRTIHRLFEEQVERNTDRIAIVEQSTHLTYRELNERIDRSVSDLKEKGVRPGSIVGLITRRSMEAVISILAIIKAGGAFLPIEPDYPEERKQYMLKDSGAELLLNVESGETISKSSLPTRGRVPFFQESTVNTNTCYIIYTSGSTGKPKGVMVDHSNIVNYIWWAIKQYVKEERVSFPLFTSLSFDLTITSIFTPLISGNTLVVYGGVSGESLIEKVMEENRVDIVKLTPSHLKLILNAWGERNIIFERKMDSRVKRFIVGGEALETKLAKEIHDMMKNPIEIYNEYGPTETTVGCMIYTYNPRDIRHAVPIGIPAGNAQVYVLDKNLEPVPKGTPGDLYVSGNGVSRGYLNRVELTEERFVTNVFNPGKKMYKTGDMARFLDDGNIEYLGRIDHQVKIRGFRIELGEIENKVKEYRKTKPVHVSFKDNIFHGAEHIDRCVKCLLPSNYPGIEFDQEGVCNTCREYEKYKTEVDRYFKKEEDFTRLVDRIKREESGKYDCLLLFSGGKDSTFVLYRLIDMGLKVLTFTFDNGYISDAAFANIKRTTAILGVENIVGKADKMNNVFVESLNTNHNVCHGCWNALNTLGVKAAHERGINLVISGLSRGQIFEMRLEGLFERGITTEEEIEKNLLLFRKTFHSKNNRFSRLMDVELEEHIVERIQFIDFFRYFSIPVKEVREYLTRKGWVQPVDTGFCSSNCIINDVGIYVFQAERGFHFYAAPLSWDCRLEVITREQGLREIEFEGQLESVDRILKEIGYYNSPVKDAIVIDNENSEGEKSLSAYIVSDETLTVTELRDYLSVHLPEYMIPAQFVQIEKIPLTSNGKVDRKALGRVGKRLDSGREYMPAGNETEKKLEALWAEILEIDKVSVESNFFELGGNSLSLIKMSSSLKRIFDKDISVANLFRLSTIRMLAKHIQEEEISLQAADEILDQSIDTMDETLSLLGEG